MPKYLIDVNLPYYFSLWKDDDYVHQKDIDCEWTDSQIWDYAKAHNLTIVSKDSDFSDRIMLQTPPPKIIHIKLGNMKLRKLHTLLNAIWEDVLIMQETNKLVNVYEDRIEGIE